MQKTKKKYPYIALNFRKNEAFASKSSTLGIVLPIITNPFYPEFVRAAERLARQRGYFLMVCNTDERPNVGLAYLQKIAGTLADGILVLHSGILIKDILAHGSARAHRFGVGRNDTARRKNRPCRR